MRRTWTANNDIAQVETDRIRAAALESEGVTESSTRRGSHDIRIEKPIDLVFEDSHRLIDIAIDNEIAGLQYLQRNTVTLGECLS